MVLTVKKIMVIGGDGFCGWPTSLRLSMRGCEVIIVDDLSKRSLMQNHSVDSLTNIRPPSERLWAWKEVSGKDIRFVYLDVVKQYEAFEDLIKKERPDTVVHLAEQPSAPFSMRDSDAKRYTVDNNVSITHNILCAIAESGLDIHLVHLGTMGVYGYDAAKLEIPEGYLSVRVNTPQGEVGLEILYPSDPGSVYHVTKCMDATLFAYYNKNNRIRITDLHQGIVWGTNTEETLLDKRLVNSFRYDGDFGTVLNRFLVQGAIGHPLTVHGTGGQTRAFIHLRNTVDCIELAIHNPPRTGGRVKIFNQLTETHRVIDLAEKVSALTGAEIRLYSNPRNEAEENTLTVCNDSFIDLGLDPIKLETGLLEEIVLTVNENKARINKERIVCTSMWAGGEPDRQGAPYGTTDI